MYGMGIFCLARDAIRPSALLRLYSCVGRNSSQHNCKENRCLDNIDARRSSGILWREYSRKASKNAVVQYICYNLPHRTLLKIQGQDTSPFLQGLITNDMQLFEEPERKTMYAHLLNVQGRTLYDIILYSLKAESGGGVLLECDSTVTESIMKHLKLYKIRRKVNISACPDLSIWAVRPKEKSSTQKPEIYNPEKIPILEDDPRTKVMGWRLVLDTKTDPLDIIGSCQQDDTEEYHTHRYAIGLPEGVKDLPPGVALPLESNLVYMEGISFSKGCYIGQELTARTHHTGVVRKRLMPVRLSNPVQEQEGGALVKTQSGKAAGKHRTGVGNLGLGLIRLAHAKEQLILKPSEDTTVTLEAFVPDWWPKDIKIT